MCAYTSAVCALAVAVALQLQIVFAVCSGRAHVVSARSFSGGGAQFHFAVSFCSLPAQSRLVCAAAFDDRFGREMLYTASSGQIVHASLATQASVCHFLHGAIRVLQTPLVYTV